ncbi:hypothetical protein [Halorubrum tibetense]|uniref:Uncharacterized protein n=1 Tax=Halorubrum tibetense TaxID=175631 RepID=A0ABD5S7H9_9EURY
MRFGEALTEALKYHAVAVVPTLIGFVIAFAALWVGVLTPLLDAVAGVTAQPELALERALGAEYNFVVAGVGVIIGIAVRRVGRTTLLFRTHGNAVVEEVDREVIPEALVNAPGSAGGVGTGADASDPYASAADADGSATDDDRGSGVIDDRTGTNEPIGGDDAETDDDGDDRIREDGAHDDDGVVSGADGDDADERVGDDADSMTEGPDNMTEGPDNAMDDADEPRGDDVDEPRGDDAGRPERDDR